MKPIYRYKLRGEIHSSGCRSLSEFAGRIGVDVSVISRICTGWVIPNEVEHQRIADGIGITIQKLDELL